MRREPHGLDTGVILGELSNGKKGDSSNYAAAKENFGI